MKFLTAVVCALVVCLPLAARQPGFRTEFAGGTIAEISNGSNIRLDLTGVDALVVRAEKWQFQVEYRKIHTLEYGQNVSRRVAEAVLISPLLLLAKSRKHFVTIEYSDEAGNQQALVFRVQKGDIRSLLAGLEARTGRRVEYQDDEARKTGR